MQQFKPRTSIIIGAVVTLVVLAGAALYVLLAHNKQNNNVTSNQDASVTKVVSTDAHNEPAPSPSERVTIIYTNDGFNPQDITIKKGTAVTVSNKSSRSLQFSSNDHPAHTDNPEMNLKVLAPGESELYTATKVGKWGYHNHLDPNHTGTVTVTD